MLNVLDLETYDYCGEIIPYCAVILIKKKIYSYYGNSVIHEVFKNLFLLNYKKEIIFIHNINFDGFLIINYLSTQHFIFDVFIHQTDLYSIKIIHNNKNLIFKCSYKILPLGLTDIAKIFKAGEKTIFPYKFVNKDNLKYRGEIPDKGYFNSEQDWLIFKNKHNIFDVRYHSLQYCENDVRITLFFIEKLKKIINSFGIKIENVLSAPSLALKIYEKNFNEEIFKFNNNLIFEKFARNSYFGGRCEVYGNPTKNEYVFHFDFSGMYAQCMEQKFPYGGYKIIREPKSIEEPGIYWIDYKSENLDIPVLPHHRLKDGKLMFTNGENTGSFWFEEIILFIEKGGIVTKIHQALIFSQYDNIFKTYVDYFSSLRKKSADLNLFSKLMINSIYGRLGMSNIKTLSFVEQKKNIDNINKNFDVIKYRELNNIVIVEVVANAKNTKKIKNNIVLASAITSKARIKLFKAQESVKNNGGRLLYSDTDSIFAAFKKNVSNEQHGEVFWDISKKDTLIKEAVFFSPKSYAILYPNNLSSVKIKGYNYTDISFFDLKNKFVKNEKLEVKNYRYINRKDINLNYVETAKYFDLNIYDKRYFINDYETKPYKYKNFSYNKAD